jgi:hypothetical protein
MVYPSLNIMQGLNQIVEQTKDKVDYKYIKHMIDDIDLNYINTLKDRVNLDKMKLLNE